MAIVLKGPWQRQPQNIIKPVAVGLGMGLRALFDMRTGTELVTGNKASANTATVQASQGKIVRDFSSTANVQFAYHPNYAVTSAITIIAYLDVDALSNFGAVISKAASSTASIPYEMRIGNGATTSDISFTRATTGGSWRGHHTGSNRITAPARRQFVMVRSAGATVETVPTVCVNGTFYTASTVAGSGTGSVGDSSLTSVYIGARAAGTTQLDGRIYWVALWNRALRNSEVVALYQRPWSLYEMVQMPVSAPEDAAPPAFIAAWANRRSQVIGAGVH